MSPTYNVVDIYAQTIMLNVLSDLASGLMILTPATAGKFRKYSASSHAISAGYSLNKGRYLFNKLQKFKFAGKGRTCWQPSALACMASDRVATPGK